MSAGRARGESPVLATHALVVAPEPNKLSPDLKACKICGETKTIVTDFARYRRAGSESEWTYRNHCKPCANRPRPSYPLVTCAACPTEFRVPPGTVAKGFGKYCSRTCMGSGQAREFTDERRSETAARSRAWIAEHGHPRGATGMTHTPEARARVGAAARRMWDQMTPEKLEVRAVKRNATYLANHGTMAPPVLRGDQPYSRCRGGKRADLGDRYFRSGWEANYARYLNLLVAQGQILGWEYEVDTFVFEGVTRGAITYTPDFKVTDLDGTVVYHEVKGWLTPRAKMALKRMAKRYPEVTIRLVDEPVYRAISRQCAGLIPNWEGR